MQTEIEAKRIKKMLRDLYYQSVAQDQEGEVSFSKVIQQFDLLVEEYDEESDELGRENSELKLRLADAERGLEEAIQKFHTIASMTENSTQLRNLHIAWIAREGNACCISHLDGEEVVEPDNLMLPEAENNMSHADRLHATRMFTWESIDYILDFDTSPPFEDTRYHPLSAGPDPADDRWIREDIPF